MKPAAGPILQAGFKKLAAGTLQWRLSCSRCGQLALNSSKLCELLCTLCDEQGEWRQVLHGSVADGARIKRGRCGTTRQRHMPRHAEVPGAGTLAMR